MKSATIKSAAAPKPTIRGAGWNEDVVRCEGGFRGYAEQDGVWVAETPVYPSLFEANIALQEAIAEIRV